MSPLLESVPVAVLTGFLGSGKSTLLNGLLRSNTLPSTAIIVNEFGDIAIDHALIEGVVKGVTLLSSGCVCCAVRSDLEAALRDLHLKRLRGMIPEYQAVILETTGLADPGPVLQTLTSRPVRELRYTLGPVIVTLDAVNGEAALKAHHEAVRQLAVADRVIVTKSDLNPATATILTLARDINPVAPIVESAGAITASTIFGTGLLSERLADRSIPHALHDHHHLSGISSYGRVIDGQLDWDQADELIRSFLKTYGDRILRFKALLCVRGVDEWIVLHGIHHSLYPPQLLAVRESGRQSRVSIIGDHLASSVADQFLDDLTALAV